MDFGKEAYFKLSELERLISNYQTLSASGLPFSRECPSGQKTAIATYSGGAAMLIVSVTSTGTGGVDIYYGGMRVSGVASGSTATAVFTTAGGGTLELLPADGVNVTDVYVSAFGAKCGFAPNTIRIAADSYGGTVYAAYAPDYLEVYRLDGGSFVSVYKSGAASDFDIACSEKGTLLAYVGVGENLIVKLLESDSAAFIDDGFRKIAVTPTHNGWAVATYDGSHVVVTRYDDSLTPLESVTVRSSKTVTGICFVKHADSLCLIVSDNGRNMICVSSDEAFADLTVQLIT